MTDEFQTLPPRLRRQSLPDADPFELVNLRNPGRDPLALLHFAVFMHLLFLVICLFADSRLALCFVVGCASLVVQTVLRKSAKERFLLEFVRHVALVGAVGWVLVLIGQVRMLVSEWLTDE